MKFAVWFHYPNPARKAGPFYPQIVEAESFEDAVEEYSKQVGRSVTGELNFVVAMVNEVVLVQRRRVREFDTRVVPYHDGTDEDED